ncbi:hypothetical protein [Arcticibacter eurypsychrophilus]|uniref:hypothetical protein n=1 Tax=Arcticibacter eurypsychrophilus TaxID=1434752 RepID=UPI00084D1C2C|nr:hypothetical protein [Arcticibacter eurypsychrophilus]
MQENMDTEQFDYQKEILHTVCMLCVTYRELFVYGLNAALCEELKDIRHVFEEGEEYPADISILEALDDVNIKTLLALMYVVENAGDTLLNINNISKEKLDAALADGIGDECIPETNENEDLVSYQYWMNDAMGYAHLTVYNLLQQCYRLSQSILDIPEDMDELLCFPTNESLEILDKDDQNVELLTTLAFTMSGHAHDLCDSLLNQRQSE